MRLFQQNTTPDNMIARGYYYADYSKRGFISLFANYDLETRFMGHKSICIHFFRWDSETIISIIADKDTWKRAESLWEEKYSSSNHNFEYQASTDVFMEGLGYTVEPHPRKPKYL